MADNATLTRRWFEEVWNQNRIQTVDELLDPNVVIHGLESAGRSRSGPTHFREFLSLFRSGLSDIRMTIEDLLRDGDKTVARVSLRAVHSGDGLGVPATGRPIVSTGIVITRWKDGRIIEAWNEFDAAGLMRQLSEPGPAVKLKA